jgi:hypothetical protein
MKVIVAAAVPLSSPPLHYRVPLVVLVLKELFVCLGQAVADGTVCVQEGVAGVDLDNATASGSSACKLGARKRTQNTAAASPYHRLRLAGPPPPPATPPGELPALSQRARVARCASPVRRGDDDTKRYRVGPSIRSGPAHIDPLRSAMLARLFFFLFF